MNSVRPVRIVILGGGFGGLYTARYLDKMLARDPGVEVTLINKENYFLFTPMLHEVAASDLDLTHIVNPIRKLLERVRFFDGEVEAIDLVKKRVIVSHGLAGSGHDHELEYDHLVLALGSLTNFFNLPGLAERALTMKSLGDAIHLRNRLIENLEESDFECALNRRDHLLTVVVAGGGFAGVETIAGVNDFLREAVAFYPYLKEEYLRTVLVHPGGVILPELGEQLGRYAQEKLRQRQVEIRTNTRVQGISDRGVELSDGALIKANILVWTAGTSPHPLLAKLGACNGECFPGGAGLVRGVGLGRLRSRAGSRGQALPAHGATCHPAGQGARAEHHGRGARRPEASFCFQNHRAIGRHWPAHRRRAHFRFQLLRLSGLVDVAHDLSEQAAALGEKNPGGAGLDVGFVFLQRSRAIRNVARARGFAPT
ncbi:hypothetical protein DWB58_25990 [candidate division KSB1 bacterium]|nr:hypothetical protein [candidate division KSB1 bacterium]